MDQLSLSTEHKLIISNYERYLQLWSYGRRHYRLAVARDFLHWWQRPVNELQASHWPAYVEHCPPSHRGGLPSFRRFLQETGQVPRPQRPAPEVRPLPDLPQDTACWVQAFLRARKRRGQKRSDRETDRRNLNLFLSTLPAERRPDLALVSHHDVEAFIEGQQDRGLAPSTVNRRLSTARSFFFWLQSQGQYEGANPVWKDHYLQLPDPLPRALHSQDVQALLATIDDVMDRALFLVLLRTGIRVGEALALTVADVDLDQASLVIAQGGKNSRGRMVYLAQDVHQALADWLAARHEMPVSRLFFTWRSHSLSGRTVSTRFHRYREQAGISRPYRVHDLRHTFATQLLNAGVPITTLQELMGHVTIRVTQRYARLAEATTRTQYFAAMHQVVQDGVGVLPDDEEVAHVGPAR
ncbi:MAG: tyrosine-type recombinase/integrase [Anaerolineae bacterium]